jgi:acetyl esterase/lipase
LSNNHGVRTYPLIDDADRTSCRPDFCVLIYPGSLTVRDKNDAVAPELSVSATNTPPTFIAMTEDDGVRVENALYYYLALKNAKVSAEMHLYPNGGHGYGLRRTEVGVTSWPDRLADWMRTSGWLKAAK